MKKFISNSLIETKKIAQEVLANLASLKPKNKNSKAIVLLLKGDLGSGKTTFVQFLAQELGVKNHLTSPTFVLMKSYKISDSATERFHLAVKNLVHLDAYRLNSGQDLLNLGWAELVSNLNNLIVLEWPERVSDLFINQPATQQINFKFLDEKTREIISF